MINKIIIIGHRGASNIAPENTLKAFQKAVELKADFIEFDVQKTKDGQLIICHDEDISRITGFAGKIERMTLKQLKEFDFGEGEKIPTLDEVVEITKGKIGLQIEVKSKNIGKKIVKILEKANLIESTIVSSFMFKELVKIQKLKPELQLASLIPYEGFLVNNPRWTKWKVVKKALDRASKHKIQYIHPHYLMVDENFVNYSHQKNLKINVWTIDVKPGMKYLVKHGVDGLITNDIETAKKVLHRAEI
jgi:glycerophosphoryl diester phosphodiesterase